MKRLLLTSHWINLDTAIGAVITSVFIASCMNSSSPSIVSITLFLTVLSIYNFDHLMDARKVKAVAKSARHRFYQENLKILSIYQLLLIVGISTIIWYLPADILRAGLVLALVTGTYFILLFFVFPNKFMLKEFMISLIYSIALFIGPIYGHTQMDLTFYNLLFWLEIMLLAFANTIIFAWYDDDIDQNEGHTSLVREVGKDKIFRTAIIILLLLIAIILSLVIAFDAYKDQSIILGMTLVLFYILFDRKRLSSNEIYRIVGDAIFIIPIIYFI